MIYTKDILIKSKVRCVMLAVQSSCLCCSAHMAAGLETAAVKTLTDLTVVTGLSPQEDDMGWEDIKWYLRFFFLVTFVTAGKSQTKESVFNVLSFVCIFKLQQRF